MRVALHSGVVVRHDAVSKSLRLKLDVLRKLAKSGIPVEVTVFAQGSDENSPEFHCVGLRALLSSNQFRNTDVHIYEFGIAYDLFDSVFVVPPTAVSMAVYHNVTPFDLVDGPEQRHAIERSLRQRHNLARVDLVASVSEYSRCELIELGFDPDRLEVLPLPASLHPAWPDIPVRGSRESKRIELLYVGRLVRSKGIYDLLEATRRLIAGGERSFRVTFAGSLQFSDHNVVASVKAAEADPGLSSTIRLVADPVDELLARLYAEADGFIVPSYHEGYCVPVIEAYTAKCPVIAYDAANLPYQVAGLGRLVPAGNVAALAEAIREHIAALREARRSGQPLLLPLQDRLVNEREWRAAVDNYLELLTVDIYQRRFLALLARVTARIPGGTPEWLSEYAKSAAATEARYS